MGDESKCKMTGSTDDCIVTVITESGNDELIWMLGSSYQDIMTTTGSHRASKDTTRNTCHYHIPINDLLDFNSKILPEKSEVFSRTPPC